MSHPTREEIVIFGTLDEQTACDHFLGKSLEEARELFCENSIAYQEDLLWMGPSVFRFYVQAAIGYIMSADATGDADFINSVAGTLEFKLEHEAQEISPIAKVLKSLCRSIIENWEKFDVNPEFYVGLRGRFTVLHEAFQQQVI